MDIIYGKSGKIRDLVTLSKPLTVNNIKDAIIEFNKLNQTISSYEDSTGYDLVIGRNKYPPKAIYGLALSKLLNMKVNSSHFSGGKKSPCFTILEKLGFDLVVKKIPKENEYFAFENLKVSSRYTRFEALEAANVNIPSQPRELLGKNRYKNCVVMFVTLNKESKIEAHKYNDVFLLDGKQFHWESQSKNTTSTPAINQIIEGFPAVLFVRLDEKIKGKTQPFIYAGRLEYIEHRSQQPVQMLFNTLDYVTSPNPDLQAIYNWGSELDLNFNDIHLAAELVKKVKTSGQGYIIDSKKRKATELHAMKVAEEHYINLGYKVIDTSANCPYDLECHDADEIRRVEVKGTMSNGNSVYVTSGEVIDANSEECETDLFIVYKIKIGSLDLAGNYPTSEGTTHIIRNWKPKAEDLEPKTYKYTV